MIRAFSWLLVGACVGSAATAVYLWSSGSDNGAVSTGTPAAFEISSAAHEGVADESDPFALESNVERVALEPSTAARDAELDAQLAQLEAVDPRQAVMLAQRLKLADDVLARLFKGWADADPEAALTELGNVRPRITQRAAALALLDVFGSDTAGIERVAAAFPPEEAMNFRADAIGNMAERDLVGAIAAAQSPDLPQPVRSVSLQRIAQIMARLDPPTAFEQARAITIPLFRSRYLNQLMDDWATVDPDAALAYLAEADFPEISMGPAIFRALAAASPEQLLSVAENFPPTTRTAAQRAALDALALLDPITAYQRVSTLPPSGDIDNLVGSIADRYAAQDPDAALAWATSLEPRSAIAVSHVLTQLAARDPARAADVVIDEILDPIAANSLDVPSLVSVLSEPLRAKSPELARVADKLAANSDPRIREQLDQLLSSWTGADAAGAIDWALGNPTALSPSSAQDVALRIGLSEPALARQAVQRLPPRLRAAWIEGASTGLARNDFDGAVAWLETYRGDPLYERALNAAIVAGASANPQAAARLIDENPQSRMGATPVVVRAWADSNPDAARAWVLKLPEGQAQDQGLTALLQASASKGSFDKTTFERISSPQTRQQALLSTLLVLGQRNPDLGRQLIDEYIDDPAARRSAESQLELGSRLRANILGLQ